MGEIFGSVDPARQGESIVEGAERIERNAAKKKESVRWSIAELKLSSEDFDWLHEWARSLLPDQTELNLQYSSRSPKFGLLFLTVAAEVCRRETEESEAWPIIRSIVWKPDVKAVLFNKQGAPKPLLCRAIEAACLRYGLRNVVGQADRMHWFTSIKLQFGLTRLGLKEQLGNWLDFDTFPSVAQLLRTDKENRSDSFACLIESLRAYQDGYKHVEEVRKLLLASPWILADWVDDVLSAAERKRSVGTAKWKPPDETTRVIDDDQESVECVGELSLVWNAGKVDFAATVREAMGELCSCDRFIRLGSG